MKNKTGRSLLPIRHALVTTSLLLSAGLLTMACATSTELESFEDIASTEQALLGDTCPTGKLSNLMQAHVCGHVTLGPFASRTANTPSNWFGTGTTTPGDGSTHVYYTLNLSGSGSSYSGTFLFSPVDSGDHGVFFDTGLTFTIQEVGGGFLTPDTAISPNPGVMSCTGFDGYEVYSLDNTKSYEIVFSSPTSSNHVLFEWVPEFRRRWYVDADDDGYGDPTQPSIRTACEPPAGYTTTTAGDCNDANGAIHPDAPEVCGDGIDSNCNGNDCT